MPPLFQGYVAVDWSAAAEARVKGRTAFGLRHCSLTNMKAKIR